MDRIQEKLVSKLEFIANEAQEHRNQCQHEYEISLFKNKQPNQLRFKKHILAFLFSGAVCFSGIYFSERNNIPYLKSAAIAVSLGSLFISNNLDIRNQIKEKKLNLEEKQNQLNISESELFDAVSLYRQEEEILWLMYGLNISKNKLLKIQDWMADIRRIMKNNILESIKIVLEEYLHESIEEKQLYELSQNMEFLEISNKLFSPDFQNQKEEFLSNVLKKHRDIKIQDNNQIKQASNAKVNATSIIGGTASGLVAGASVAAISSTSATILGKSKDKANSIALLGGLAALVGVGVIAAGGIKKIMQEHEQSRIQKEQEDFSEAFIVTEDILKILNKNESDNHKIKSCNKVLKKIATFENKELKSQDKELKEYISVLKNLINDYIVKHDYNNLINQREEAFHQVTHKANQVLEEVNTNLVNSTKEILANVSHEKNKLLNQANNETTQILESINNVPIIKEANDLLSKFWENSK